jgi:hypothetical protein
MKFIGLAIAVHAFVTVCATSRMEQTTGFWVAGIFLVGSAIYGASDWKVWRDQPQRLN